MTTIVTIVTSIYNRLHRDGDYYAALRDAESALSLCPSSKKVHQRRLRCLLHLGPRDVAQRLLIGYKDAFPSDREFVTRFQTELDKHSSDGGCDYGIARVHTCIDSD